MTGVAAVAAIRNPDAATISWHRVATLTHRGIPSSPRLSTIRSGTEAPAAQRQYLARCGRDCAGAKRAALATPGAALFRSPCRRLELRPDTEGNIAANRIGHEGVDALSAVDVAGHRVVIEGRLFVEDVLRVDIDLVAIEPTLLEVIGGVKVEGDIGIDMIAADHQRAVGICRRRMRRGGADVAVGGCPVHEQVQ